MQIIITVLDIITYVRIQSCLSIFGNFKLAAAVANRETECSKQISQIIVLVMCDIEAEGSKENHSLINLQQPDCISAAQAWKAHGRAWTSSFREHCHPLGGNAVGAEHIAPVHLAQSEPAWQALGSGTQSCF